MADDWQVGDLAMLVTVGALNSSEWVCAKGEGMKPGMVFLVASVVRSSVWTALGFDNFKSSWRDGEWDARSFRKIRPLSDEERASFMADLDEPARRPKRESATMTFGVK
jgi:hypothetical protein